ncbi:MAG: hypothetical protein Q8R54_06215 [Methylobacter sp.]|nr:hypothetical protein [Methylobacter sp.]
MTNRDAQARGNQLTQAILSQAFRGELSSDWCEQTPTLIRGESSTEALMARIQIEQGHVPSTKAKKQL